MKLFLYPIILSKFQEGGGESDFLRRDLFLGGRVEPSQRVEEAVEPVNCYKRFDPGITKNG